MGNSKGIEDVFALLKGPEETQACFSPQSDKSNLEVLPKDGVTIPDGEYFIRIHSFKGGVGHFSVEFLEPGDKAGNGKFFGKSPNVASAPLASGKVSPKREAVEYETASKQGSIYTKTVNISKQEYDKAINEALRLEKDPGFYTFWRSNCVEFVQKIYAASGKKGDFMDLYSKEEINKIGSMGAVHARVRYGTEGEVVEIIGKSKEDIAKEYNVSVDSIREDFVVVEDLATSSSHFPSFIRQKVYIIDPQKHEQKNFKGAK